MRSLISKYKNTPVQVRAALWFLICSFLQKGISVITTPIFSRLLSTTEYGDFSVFNSWLGIVTIFVTLHMYSGVFAQGIVKFDDDRNNFASAIQGMTLALSLAWTGIYLIARDFWNDLFSLTTVQMLSMLVMIWTTAVFQLWATEQRTQYKYQILVIATLVTSIAKPVVGIIFVILAEDKVTARILGLVLVELIGYTWMFFSQLKKSKKIYSREYWKYALLFSLPLIPHYLSQTVLNSSDRIMIKSMVDASSAGIYSLAYSISQIMTLFNTALLQTITPWIYQKIKADKMEDISKVAYTSLVGIAAVNIFLIALAPEAVAIFAPNSYHEAIYVIPPVAMSVFFTFMYSMFSNFEFYYEKTTYIMLASVSGAILNIILNYIFIKIFGYFAAGYTTLFCYIVYALCHYCIMRHVCEQNLPGQKIYDTKLLVIMSVLFIITGLTLLITYDYPIIRYLIVFVMLSVVVIKREFLVNKIRELLLLNKTKKPGI